MSHSRNFTVSARRSRAQRLTPAGWFLVGFTVFMAALLLFAGARWIVGQWPLWFPPAAPEIAEPSPVVATPVVIETPAVAAA